MATTAEQHTVLPPEQAGEEELKQFTSALADVPAQQRGQAKLVGPDNTEVEVPEQVYAVLRNVATAMSQGLAVTVAPHNTLLTTQEAADMLNISRPTLVRLLNEGEVSYEQRGRHRRVRLADVLDYQQLSRQERRTALDDETYTTAHDGTADDIEDFTRTR